MPTDNDYTQIVILVEFKYCDLLSFINIYCQFIVVHSHIYIILLTIWKFCTRRGTRRGTQLVTWAKSHTSQKTVTIAIMTDWFQVPSSWGDMDCISFVLQSIAKLTLICFLLTDFVFGIWEGWLDSFSSILAQFLISRKFNPEFAPALRLESP